MREEEMTERTGPDLSQLPSAVACRPEGRKLFVPETASHAHRGVVSGHRITADQPHQLAETQRKR